MHRNTLLFVSLLAVIAAFLLGVQAGRALPNTASQQEAQPTTTPTLTPTPKVTYATYTDTECDISLQYPSSLEVLESTNSGTILTDPDNEKETIVIACQNNIPRIPLPPEKIVSMTLRAADGATVSAKMYQDVSEENNTRVDKLIFTHPKSGQDVFIAGYGLIYQQVVASLKLQ